MGRIGFDDGGPAAATGGWLEHFHLPLFKERRVFYDVVGGRWFGKLGSARYECCQTNPNSTSSLPYLNKVTSPLALRLKSWPSCQAV
ncbi:MAG: hypothetical protein KatS3mg030_307 [Saprospiraceae bacterium]|nr:MAG: hypothetical protein KatS3mg030_307 [Saprospiraceae bacterium]